MPIATRSSTLAIDVGTSSARAILFDDRHQIIYQAACPLALDRLDGVRVEQSGEQIVAATQEVLEQVDRYVSETHCHIATAGLAVQRSSVVVWQRQSGIVMTPVLSWQDRRTDDWLQRQKWDPVEMMARTGLPLSAHYGGIKIRWLLDHAVDSPDTSQLAAGPLAAFLVQRLTTESTFAVDVTNAARMQLIDLQHPANWDGMLLAKFGLPSNILPPIRPAIASFGHVTLGNRSAHPPIPLELVCGDQFAALHATDQDELSPILINLGTGGFIMAESNSAPPQTPLLRSPGVTEKFILEGTVNGVGAAIQWATRHLNIDASSRPWEHWPIDKTSPLTFVNNVGGRGSPWWQSSGRSYWIDDGGAEVQPSDAAAAMVAVLDSIADMVAANFQEMRRAGIDCRRLKLSGGLSRIPLLRERIRQFCERPVDVLTISEATASGVAKLLSDRKMCP